MVVSSFRLVYFGNVFWRGQCFGGVSVLEGSVFWRGQYFGGVSVLEGSVLWRGQCFGVISVSYLFSFLCVVFVLFVSVFVSWAQCSLCL